MRRKDSLRCGDVTIEEEMLYLMENIRQLLAELPEDIVKYSEDSARDENGESISDHFAPVVSLLEIYLRRIEDLMSRKLFSVMELEKLDFRYKLLEKTVLSNSLKLDKLATPTHHRTWRGRLAKRSG